MSTTFLLILIVVVIMAKSIYEAVKTKPQQRSSTMVSENLDTVTEPMKDRLMKYLIDY